MNRETKIITIILALVMILGIFLYGCVGKISPTNVTNTNVTNMTTANETGATTNNTIEVGNAITVFGTELYQKLANDSQYTDKNIFFSPYSISTALAMTYEGAQGQTADEMQSVFHFPVDNVSRRSAFARIYNEMNRNEENYSLNTANALWVQKDYPFLSNYFSVISQYYKGNVTNLDFGGDSEGSRIKINGWVANQTNNKIIDLIPKGVIDQSTRLVLTNAIYFKGKWAQPYFNKNETQEQDFNVSQTESVKTPMMTTLMKFNYAETGNLQILELPYSDSNLSMLVLLPKDSNMALLEANLNLGNLSEWRNALSEKEVNVYLPRFKFKTDYLMADTLSGMGMPTAFNDAADFSGMTGKKELKISQVVHRAYIDVNEEGTEAAAATAVVVSMTAISPDSIPVFRADHPFIFLIQDKETGAVLFLGRVSDPISE